MSVPPRLEFRAADLLLAAVAEPEVGPLAESFDDVIDPVDVSVERDARPL